MAPVSPVVSGSASVGCEVAVPEDAPVAEVGETDVLWFVVVVVALELAPCPPGQAVRRSHM